MLKIDRITSHSGRKSSPWKNRQAAQTPRGMPRVFTHMDMQGRKFIHTRTRSPKLKSISFSGVVRLWKNPATQRFLWVTPSRKVSGTSSISEPSMMPSVRPFFQKRWPTSGSSMAIQGWKLPSSIRSSTLKNRPLPSTQ